MHIFIFSHFCHFVSQCSYMKGLALYHHLLILILTLILTLKVFFTQSLIWAHDNAAVHGEETLLWGASMRLRALP